MKIYLASASPRRQEILSQIGIEYEVMVSGADESTEACEPSSIVEELSYIKALAVAEQLEGECENFCVIGADTIVALDGKILGKPSSKDDAFRMLEALSGREHQVYTGVTIIVCEGDAKRKVVTFNEATTVNMYEFTKAEIADYIATGEPMDKAGAYGIQGKASKFVKGIVGDYYNVMGLPGARLYHELCKLEVI